MSKKAAYMASAIQKSPSVMMLRKMMTIQKSIAIIWGIQKRMEFTLEMTLVYTQDAKHHFSH